MDSIISSLLKSPIVLLLTMVGGLAGLIAFSWQVFEGIKSYLVIKVEVKRDNDNFSIFTQVQNKNSIFTKIIGNAFLIISPENDPLKRSGNLIADYFGLGELMVSMEYVAFPKDTGPDSKFDPIEIGDNTIFVTLPYYYSENMHVADEELTFTCSVNHDSLFPGRYSVRFFIFPVKRFIFKRYHRSTQDLLVIPENQ